VTEPSHAVFLSYASQDAEAARKICESLRAAGIEVWFDQSELRGGDAWDRSIHEQIQACALFMPIISANAHARVEGYFRLEWKLAVDRSHRMAPDQAFLLPVVIDDTRQSDTRIPDRFRELQWTRLPGGVTTPALVDRVRVLLWPEPLKERVSIPPANVITDLVGPSRRPIRASIMAIAVTLAVALTYVAIDKLSNTKHSASPPTAPAASAGVAPAAPAGVAPAAFRPPPHSIAVLPFVNMSGDKEQEYFSEGLTEELLNSLARINELQVAARTSSFSFQGEHPDIATVARKLNVGAVLEGSVRRSARTMRVTAQLVNGITGFHVWSQTYDRNVGDVLKLQTEIATAVAGALKVTLLGDEAAKIEVGGTHNAAAFDAHLRALQTYWKVRNGEESQAAIAGFTQAIRLDPDYAVSYADRSLALSAFATIWAVADSAVRIALDKALADARKAVALAPTLGEGHLALAVVYAGLREFTPALEEYERALALAPGDGRVLRDYGAFAVNMGRTDSGLKALRRAAELDPLNANSHAYLGAALSTLRRYEEAIEAYKEALAVGGDPGIHVVIGEAYYLLGDLQSARTSCEENAAETIDVQICLALIYDKLGQHADAEAELRKIKATSGDARPYAYATIYAQWGQRAQALEWLETALRLRDPGLEQLRTDPLLDPVRKEPRFQAIEQALKFPD
jgi:TolB-like protein/tetratricopeptide (TPR) repeat protein